MKPRKVKLLAGEQKATENSHPKADFPGLCAAERLGGHRGQLGGGAQVHRDRGHECHVSWREKDGCSLSFFLSSFFPGVKECLNKDGIK